ncbi:DUF1456 family protein [Maribacter sp. 2307ULW6-5]|uniref:DUF1456 family protein n=1 Tax=Maribacter sp. 2307ULW6-5 TaxID=3386275 RepID=UPI0039BD1FE2
MTNNDILKKLRVALKLRDDHIVDILKLVDFNMSKSELGAFFRNEDHPNYMECGDQVLRNFLNGLVIFLRGSKERPKNPGEVLLGLHQPIQPKAKPSFRSQQRKNVDPALPKVNYKNKKKS